MNERAQDLPDIMREIMGFLQMKLREELAAQGHILTGRLSDSIDFQVSETSAGVVGLMMFEDYGVNIELGVSADKIPFTPGKRGKGGRSRYIEGLISFWKKRGLSGREAIGAAFATATKHKREGMPTRSSYAFSRTGKRTGFVREVLQRDMPTVAALIEKKYGAFIQLSFAESIANERLNVEL